MAGDTYLMLPSDKFINGLISFFVAHLFYIAAFMSDGGIPRNILFVIPGLLVGIIYLRVLLPKTGGMSIPVVFYTVVLVLLLWFSLERISYSGSESSELALAGAIFFLISDAILGINRFVKNSKGAQVTLLASYYLAQLLLASSV